MAPIPAGSIRKGNVDYLKIASSVLATLVPSAGIVNTGFAFTSYDEVWKAMDGDLGKFTKGEIENVGVLQVSESWDKVARRLDQVRNWDMAQLISLIEINIGRDLQYIRFNGSLIGGRL